MLMLSKKLKIKKNNYIILESKINKFSTKINNKNKNSLNNNNLEKVIFFFNLLLKKNNNKRKKYKKKFKLIIYLV